MRWPWSRPVRKPMPRTASQIDIAERLILCQAKDRDSIIYVGNLVENTLNGPFGEVIRALTAGRIDIELRSNRDGKLSSDRILGRCEMGNQLWHDLETFVIEKDAAKRPVREAERNSEERHTADEPSPDA